MPRVLLLLCMQMVSFPYSLFFPLTLPSLLVLFCTFPFTVGASDIARIICSHETACTDLGLARAPIAKASLPLAANDSVADCHRFCTLVLEETELSPCKFTYPNGSRLSLVVLDDDGKILSSIISQRSRLIVCSVCAWHYGNTKCLMPFPPSSHCYLPPPPSLLPSLPPSHPLPSFPLSPPIHPSLLTISSFLPLELLVGFSSNFEQVREDSGPLALTLQSSQAAGQPFTVHLDSRLMAVGDISATGECSVCCRRRMELGWISLMWMNVVFCHSTIRAWNVIDTSVLTQHMQILSWLSSSSHSVCIYECECWIMSSCVHMRVLLEKQMHTTSAKLHQMEDALWIIQTHFSMLSDSLLLSLLLPIPSTYISF